MTDRPTGSKKFSGPDAPGQVVLRGLAVAPDPHSLARPTQLLSGPRVAALHAEVSNVVPFEAAARPARDPDTGYHEGFQKGVKDGYAKGYREGMQEAAGTVEKHVREAVDAAVARAQESWVERTRRLDELLGNLAASSRDCVESAQDDMIALAFEAVCRVLGEKAVTRDGVAAQLHRILSVRRGSEVLTIHLNPDDARLLQEDAALIDALRGAGAGQFQWKADPTVVLGGCIVHSSDGGLDARLETQIASLKGLLLQARQASAAPVGTGVESRGAQA